MSALLIISIETLLTQPDPYTIKLCSAGVVIGLLLLLKFMSEFENRMNHV